MLTAMILNPTFSFIVSTTTNTEINVDIEAGKESPGNDISPSNAPPNSSVCVVLAVGNPKTLRPQDSVDADSNALKR